MKRPFNWIRRTVRTWTWWDTASLVIGGAVGLLLSVPLVHR